MACQREHGGPATAQRCARLSVLAAAAWIAGLTAMPAAAAAAAAGPGAAVQPAEIRADPWIAITSVNPGFAQPTTKVTVSGFVANPTASPLRGLSVQLGSSVNTLTSAGMASYLTAPEPTPIDYAISRAQLTLRFPVPAHGTEQWHLTLTGDQVGMHTFGVYPLAAHLYNAGVELGADRTFLPFWPGKQAARTLKPASIAWVWPLIDTPQQTVCGTLTSNELARSVARGGRLNSLLAAGRTAGRQALLTWAIDPALLSDVRVMTKAYRVTGTGKCPAGQQKPARSAAKTWLAGVQAVAAQQDYFTTPYADVDVAALARAGLDGELQAALADGSLTAKQVTIPGTQKKKILGQAQQVTQASVGPIAWPAGGLADYGVLEALAKDGIRTVILNSRMIHTPAAVTILATDLGVNLNVLLANNTLTQILSGRRDQITGLVASGYATPPGALTQARLAAAFAKEQWFLAGTAVIAAGAPASGAMVVAPPRRWNPLPGVAAALLADTGKAPWLRPATVAALASMAGTQSQRGQLPSRPVTRGELNGSLLRQAGHLYQQVRLLDSILAPHGNGYLSTAVDTVESSAWRGRKAEQRRAKQLLRHDLAYVNGQLRQVSIVGKIRVTLGGQNGVVPVSVRNGLGQAVTVRLEASAPPADHLTIGKFNGLVTVQGHTQRTIKIPVTATQAGTATLTLRLVPPAGRPLLTRSSLTVATTHFGTLAIVIISVALGVFLLSATARAIRRSGPQDGGAGQVAEAPNPMPSTRDPASAGGEPDTVVPGDTDDRRAAKEADEHASAPGRADRT